MNFGAADFLVAEVLPDLLEVVSVEVGVGLIESVFSLLQADF